MNIKIPYAKVSIMYQIVTDKGKEVGFPYASFDEAEEWIKINNLSTDDWKTIYKIDISRVEYLTIKPVMQYGINNIAGENSIIKENKSRYDCILDNLIDKYGFNKVPYQSGDNLNTKSYSIYCIYDNDIKVFKMLKFDFKASFSSVPLSDSIVNAMNSDNSKVLGVETNFVTSSDSELMVMIDSDGKYGNIPARNLAFIEMLSDDDSLAIENKLELTYQLEKDAYHLEKEKELMIAEEDKDLYSKFINILKRNSAFTKELSNEDRLAIENRLALSILQEQSENRIERIQYLCALLA